MTQYESALLVERWTMSLDLDILWHGTLDDALDAFPTGQGSPLTQAWLSTQLRDSTGRK